MLERHEEGRPGDDSWWAGPRRRIPGAWACPSWTVRRAVLDRGGASSCAVLGGPPLRSTAAGVGQQPQAETGLSRCQPIHVSQLPLSALIGMRSQPPAGKFAVRSSGCCSDVWNHHYSNVAFAHVCIRRWSASIVSAVGHLRALIIMKYRNYVAVVTDYPCLRCLVDAGQSVIVARLPSRRDRSPSPGRATAGRRLNPAIWQLNWGNIESIAVPPVGVEPTTGPF